MRARVSGFAGLCSVGAKKRQFTLGTQFKMQLEALMLVLNATDPHFVRCMKPNDLKKASTFQATMMLAQLRYAGLLEVCVLGAALPLLRVPRLPRVRVMFTGMRVRRCGVCAQVCRIRQIGYPVRKSFEEFVFRYRCLYLGCGSDHRALLNHLATKGLARHGQWQIGHSKVRGERRGGLALPAAVVLWLPLRALAAWLALTELVRVLSCRAFQIFYRNSQQSDFEAAREEALKGVVTRMQRQARKFIIRCRYARWTRIINVIKEAIGARTLERLEVSWRECFWTWSRWQC